MADENKLGEAFVEITARFDKFQRDLNEVKRNTERTASAANASFKRIGTGINSLNAAFTLLKTAAVVKAAESIFSFGKRAIEAGDRLDELSQKTGVGVERFQALSLAAQRSGVDAEELGQALTFFSRRLGDANAGSKEASDAFAALGIDIRQGTEQALNDFLSKFNRIPNASSAAAAAIGLFGRSAGNLIPFFRLGLQGVNDLEQHFKSLGLIMSEDVAKKSAVAADKLDDLSAVFTAAGRRLGFGLIGPLTALADFFTRSDVIAGIDALIKEIQQLGATSIEEAQKIGALWTSLQQLLGTANNRVDWEKQLKLNSLRGQIEDIEKELASAGEHGAKGQFAGIDPETVDALKAKLAELRQEMADTEAQAAKLRGDAAAERRTSPVNPRGALPTPGQFTPAQGGDPTGISRAGDAAKAAQAKLDQFNKALGSIQRQIAEVSAGDAFDSYWYDLADAMDAAGIEANETGKRVDELTTAVDRLHRQKAEKGIDVAQTDNAAIEAETAAITKGEEAYKAYNEARDIDSNVKALTDSLTALGVEKAKIEELTATRRKDLEAKLEAQKAADRVTFAEGYEKETTALRADTDAVNAGSDAYKAYEKARDLESKVAEIEAEAKAHGYDAEQVLALGEAYRATAQENQAAHAQADAAAAAAEAAAKAQDELRASVLNFGSTFSSAVEDAIVDGKDLQTVFVDLLKDIERLIIRSLILKAIQAGLDYFYPSLSGAGAGAAVQHQGGVVGLGGAQRIVDPGIFANAPRMHAGGLVGLKPGEVPTILQKGETVLPKGTKMGGSVSQSIVVNVNANGGDPVQNKALAEQTAKVVQRAVRGEMGAYIRSQQRPGGQLNPT